MTKEPIYCLIVEDDVYIAEFMKEAISSPHIYTLLAEDGEEAINILASGTSVDIIITDINMPKLGGEALIKQVRKISPRTLIIVATGYASISSAVEMIKQGVFDYLTKPVELDVLLNTFDRAIDQVEKFRQKRANNDINQIWHIGQFIDKNLTPDILLDNVLGSAIKACNGDGGVLFLRMEDKSWVKGINLAFENEKASQFLEKVTVNLGPWTGIGQEEVHGSLMKVFDDNNSKIIAAPFVDSENVNAILLVRIEKDNYNLHTSGLLAVYCSQIYSIVNMAIGITKLLQANEEAIKAHAALEKLHEELKQSAKLACIGELAAGIAHDINTPLTCIIGFISLYMRFLDSDTTTKEDLVKYRNYLNNALTESQRCQKILNNLLLFSKKESKQFSKFSITDLLQHTKELLEKQFEGKNVTIVFDIPSDIPHVMGSSDQIQQVVMNLLVNAKNAMPNGGSITIKVSDLEDTVKITLTDQGKGIPKENLTKIFEPFYTTNMSGKGTGLGLSISKKIIQEHGGDLFAESVVGEGSTFTLILAKD